MKSVQWKVACNTLNESLLKQSQCSGTLKPGKPVCVLPAPTRPSKQRRALSLYGRFVQSAGDLRRQRVCALPNILSYISFQAGLFNEGAKV